MTNFFLLAPLIAIAAVSIPLTLHDFRSHRLPNKYTIPVAASTLFFLFAAAITTGDYQRLLSAIIAMVLTLVIGILLARYATFGMGDVKLLLSLNAWLAWHDPWLIAMSLTAGLVVANFWALLVWLKKKDPSEHIALGPFLLLGFAFFSFQPSSELFTAVGESLA